MATTGSKRGKIKPVVYQPNVLYTTTCIKHAQFPPIPKKNYLSFLSDDSRIIGILNDEILVNIFANLISAESLVKKGFDLIEIPHQWKHEAKVANYKGVDFSPSFMKGKGRKFDPVAYKAWLPTISSMIITDVSHLSKGELRIIGVPSAVLQSMKHKMAFRETQDFIDVHTKAKVGIQ